MNKHMEIRASAYDMPTIYNVNNTPSVWTNPETTTKTTNQSHRICEADNISTEATQNLWQLSQHQQLKYSDFSVAQNKCHVGAYDVVQLRVTSIHLLQDNRESCRILGIAAGESLHNIYRVVMTSLGQREDRARLVFHSWVLPDGRTYGNGPRYKEVLKYMQNDREIYLNELPLCIGYQIELIFGKCCYLIVIEDIFSGLTDEQDLIWTPRVCYGSYGEAIPFDLCYFPHLFRKRTSKQQIPLDEDSPIDSEEGESFTGVDDFDSADSANFKRFKHLRPTTYRNHYLNEELDELNSFIRQHSKIKPLLRKNRPEFYIPDDQLRRQYFRMTPRKFFLSFWAQQMLKQYFLRPGVQRLMSTPETQYYGKDSQDSTIPTTTSTTTQETQHSENQMDFVTYNNDNTDVNIHASQRRMFPRCRVSKRITVDESPEIKISLKTDSPDNKSHTYYDYKKISSSLSSLLTKQSNYNDEDIGWRSPKNISPFSSLISFDSTVDEDLHQNLIM